MRDIDLRRMGESFGRMCLWSLLPEHLAQLEPVSVEQIQAALDRGRPVAERLPRITDEEIQTALDGTTPWPLRMTGPDRPRLRSETNA